MVSLKQDQQNSPPILRTYWVQQTNTFHTRSNGVCPSYVSQNGTYIKDLLFLLMEQILHHSGGMKQWLYPSNNTLIHFRTP